MRQQIIEIVVRGRDLSSRAIRGVQNSLQSLAVTARNSAGAVTAAFAGIAVGSAFRTLTEGFIATEDVLRRTQAVVGGTQEDFENLAESASRLGSTTLFTARQVAEGQLILSRAGFTLAETLEGIPAVLDAAVVAGADVAQIADVAVAAVRAFNQPVSALESITNQLVATANTTNTTVLRLGQAIGVAGSAAASAGFQLADVTTLFGALQDAGLRAERAATGVQKIFLEIANNDGFRETLQGLGADVTDLVSIIDAIDDGTAQSFAAINEAGIEAANALRTLAFRGSESIAQLRQNVVTNTTAVSEGITTITQSVRSGLDLLNSAVQGAFANISETALTGFTENLEDLSGVISRLTAEGAFDGLGAALNLVINGLTQAATAVVSFSSALITLIGLKIATFLATATLGAAGFAAQALASATATTTWSLATATLVERLAALRLALGAGLLSPLGLVVAGFGAVVVGTTQAVSALREYGNATRLQIQSEQELANQLEFNAERRSAIIARNIEEGLALSDLAIKTTEELRNSSIAENEFYLDQLQRSRRFTQATIDQAREAGDALAVAFATDDIETLNRLIPETAKEIEGLRRALFGIAQGEATSFENLKTNLATLGLSVEGLADNITAAEAKIIGSLDNIAFDSNNNIETVLASVNAAVEKINSPEGITALIEKIQELQVGFGVNSEEAAALGLVIRGLQADFANLASTPLNLEVVSAEVAQLRTDLESLNVVRTDDIRGQFDQLLEAFNRLRNNGTASADEIGRAYGQLVEQARPLLEQLPPPIRRIAEEALRAAAAGVQLRQSLSNVGSGLSDGLSSAKELVDQFVNARREAAQIKTNTDGTASSAKSLASVFNEATEALKAGRVAQLEARNAAQDSAKAERDRVTELAKAQGFDETRLGNARQFLENQEKLAEAEQRIAKDRADAAATSSFVQDVIDATTAAVGRFSDAAAEAFNANVFNELDVGTIQLEAVSDNLVEATVKFQEFQRAASNGLNTFSGIAATIAARGQQFIIETIRQTDAADRFFEAVAAGNDRLALSVTGSSSAVSDLTRRFNLLDDTTLNKLSSEINRINREAQALGETLEREVLSAQRELANLQGDGVEAQRLANLEALRQAEENLLRAQQIGDAALIAAAQERLDIQRQINALRLEEAADRQREQEQQARDRDANNNQQSNTNNDNNSGGTSARSGGDTIIGVLPIPPESAEELIRNGLSDEIIRSTVNPAIERLRGLG